MAFPDPSLVAPALAPWQLSYGGLVFGGIVPGSAYQLQSLTVDMPDVASGDVQRAVDQGEFAGLDVLPGADITLVQAVRADEVSLDHAVQALGAVLGPGGVTEAPLWLGMPSATFCRLVRPRRHNCPIDINRVFAKGTIATTQWHATDPRWYAARHSQSVGIPPSVGGGLAIPVSFPAIFASGAAGGELTVVNSGPFESRPVLEITGPAVNPRIANASLPGSPTIALDLTLNAGDVLSIDTDWQSVVLIGAGTTVGESRQSALAKASTWWNLPANSSSTIVFTSADLGASSAMLTVKSASSWLSL